MIDIVFLQDTLNPISAQERVKINQNWDALRRGFSSLQNQISFLAGGAEVDEIVARIERAIQDAQTNTQNAIDNVNNNYAEKLVEINQSLNDLSTALTNTQTATSEANAARDNAMTATNSALSAVNQLQTVISNFSPRGEFVLGTQYYKNNIVGDGQGNSYIAIKDNVNFPLNSVANWMLLSSRGLQGIQGEKGETGSGFLVKGYFANIQELESAIVSPETGDAYGVGSVQPYDIYIYDGLNNVWVNNGALQGAKGDRGERGEVGPAGPPGESVDVTEINQSINNIDQKLTTHSAERASKDEYGHVRIGDGLNVNDGVISADIVNYTLPIASNDLLGGIRPDGNTITVNPNTGIASVNSSSVSNAFRGCLVYKRTQQSFASGTQLNKVLFDAVSYDTDGLFDLSSSTITIGSNIKKIRITSYLEWEANTNGIRAMMIQYSRLIKTLPFVRVNSSQTGSTTLSIISPVIDVVEGDVFNVGTSQNSGAALRVLALEASFLSVEVIE